MAERPATRAALTTTKVREEPAALATVGVGADRGAYRILRAKPQQFPSALIGPDDPVPPVRDDHGNRRALEEPDVLLTRGLDLRLGRAKLFVLSSKLGFETTQVLYQAPGLGHAEGTCFGG